MIRVFVIVAVLAAVVLVILSRTNLMRDRPVDVSVLRNPITPTPEALEIGSRIYQQHCAVCHGTDGTGHGPGAVGLNPRPADLRVHTAMGHSDGELFRGVSNGVSGTAMPAFRTTLSEEDRWYVITFIRSTFTLTDK